MNVGTMIFASTWRNLLLLCLLLFCLASLSGGVPASAEEIAAGRSGQDLIDFLRSGHRPTSVLTYKQARKKMFSEIDNRSGRVRCVYTGVEVATTDIPDSDVMNTEHTWPQSKFDERSPMKTDLFQLFPTLSRVNGERANNAFGEIPDTVTEFWWRSEDPESSPPSARHECSESVDDRFEPREDHKGNVARAMLYFWVIYGNDGITPQFIHSQLDTLMAWHEADPADAAERERDNRIAAVQGNHNPFIVDPALARRVVSTDVAEAALARRAAIRRAPAAVEAPAAATSPISIRIACWNMQSTMNRDRPESDPEYLAELMGQKQGIQLWGLSEVADLQALRAFEKGAELGEGADFVPILGKTGGSDRLAVLYNATILDPVGEPFALKRETLLSPGLRASLVVKFKGKRTGQEFLFVVNHLKRGEEQNPTRLEQAQNLNVWARGQQLPIIAVGDFNFDYKPDLGHLGLPHRDGGFDALTKDRVFEWIKPSRLLKTQADDEYNSVLDFIFVANAPFGWTGESRILDREGDQLATENDFDDDSETTDHRPVDAILFGGAPAPLVGAGVESPPAVAAAASSDSRLIGAWNIEHLGRDGDTTDPEHIADYIIGSQVDLLALEEIYDTDGIESTRTNQKLDVALAKIKSKTGNRWEYRLFPKSTHEPQSEQAKQLTGVAWNTSRVTLVGQPKLIPVAHGNDRPNDFWRRQPFAAKFATGPGKADFVVIPLHMRSNSTAAGQTVQPADLRAREAESLLSQLDQLRQDFSDRDIILLGDTNVLSGSEAAIARFTSAGFRDLNPADMKTWMNKGKRKSPFDRFLVPNGQAEFQSSTQEAVLSFPAGMNARKFNREVSDHIMVRMRVAVSDDDD